MMILFSLIAALALEQIRPLGNRNRVWLWFTRYANYLERHLNGGSKRFGLYAWLLAVMPVILISIAGYYILYAISPVFAWFWNVLVLYFTMGFRHFSTPFSEMALAYSEGRDLDAKEAFQEWTGKSFADLSDRDISRMAIERGIIESYRHVFGPMFWFMVLPGPAGAILFRLSSILAQKWGTQQEVDKDSFGIWAKQVGIVLDWLPARLMAISFAIMGNFEETIYCWRSQVSAWGGNALSVILAAASGALGVRLEDPIRTKANPSLEETEANGYGEEADPHHLRSAIGLVWRSVLVWLGLLLLFCLARLG